MCMSGKNSGNFEKYFLIHFNELKHLNIFQKKSRGTHFNARAM